MLNFDDDNKSFSCPEYLSCWSLLLSPASVNKVHLLLSLTSKSINIFVQNYFGLFWLVNGAWPVQISLLIQTRWLSLHGGSIINGLKLNTSEWWICFLQTCSFSLHKMLIDGLEWCGVLVDFCDVFISCLDSHSDGTHSLQSIHWWTSDGMLHFSKPDEETDSFTSWMAWGWLHFQHIFIFVWNTLLKYTYESQNRSPKMEII